MITATIKSSLFAKSVSCKSQDVDLSMYEYDMSECFIKLVKNDDVFARSDCLSELEYPIGKRWDIYRCYKGKLLDRVVDSEDVELLRIKRNYMPEEHSFLNNYLKIDALNGLFSIVTEHKQWKLFSPVEVKAFCQGEVDLDLLVIGLLLAWFRYEYNSHDQMY
ncbi:hypothetical protein O5O45_17850 [Hahella aquimaris]|uniref:hypothetical protein n=1 Tax=Hahella sp. HNIBRBA332 TaxID=3015983 RepID=UPI00273BC0BC|nr:hypothetical protein [Hahella sp. HNIBRBA332]WLQ11598.1 hypothetical protein O5O45_17850 [Hahella sp. HNIBRBA332]